jgi:hypothetical protein
MSLFTADPALTMHEWDINAAQTRIKKLEDALLWIAVNDWAWVGAGSDRRTLTETSKVARRCLGLPLEAKPGWPHENGEEADLRKHMREGK